MGLPQEMTVGRQGGTEQQFSLYSLAVLEARSTKSKSQQRELLQEALRETLSPASLPGPGGSQWSLVFIDF